MEYYNLCEHHCNILELNMFICLCNMSKLFHRRELYKKIRKVGKGFEQKGTRLIFKC